ncbi:hypothetical protein TcasGA2_TC013498 [Tribolium castaneum]|uniref:Uncharacterized protein n=1 Tax=Tribolium castaneum TaxID=7070 RepID=D6WL71_TRICA|nr:hypothetical protein TcasGA2_TC013498 [Tribolium castaneum]
MEPDGANSRSWGRRYPISSAVSLTSQYSLTASLFTRATSEQLKHPDPRSGFSRRMHASSGDQHSGKGSTLRENLHISNNKQTQSLFISCSSPLKNTWSSGISFPSTSRPRLDNHANIIRRLEMILPELSLPSRAASDCVEAVMPDTFVRNCITSSDEKVSLHILTEAID